MKTKDFNPRNDKKPKGTHKKDASQKTEYQLARDEAKKKRKKR